ncbi:unnamed protein product, partial [Polarella glacialis]
LAECASRVSATSLRNFRSVSVPRVPWAAGLRSALTPGLVFRAGGSLLLMGWASGQGLARSASRCDDQELKEVPRPSLAQKVPQTKQRGGLLRALGTCLAVAGALAAWGVIVGIWAGAITLPFIFATALATSRWTLASGLGALFALPHVVHLPTWSLFRRPVFFGVKRWLGPEGTVRVLDFSQSEGGDSQPEAEPEPGGAAGRKQLLCYHPHGIYSLGLLTVCEEKPELKILSSSFLYHCAPVFRVAISMLFGQKYGSVGRSDLTATMKAGESPLMLVPGGFHEATITCPGHERVFLKSRRGFVKYALRYGYDLVPCYSIGEADLMSNPQGGWGWRFFLNAMSIPAVLPWGFPLLPLLPRRGVELVTGIGPAVKMPLIPNPTDADVKEHHQRYIAAL